MTNEIEKLANGEIPAPIAEQEVPETLSEPEAVIDAAEAITGAEAEISELPAEAEVPEIPVKAEAPEAFTEPKADEAAEPANIPAAPETPEVSVDIKKGELTAELREELDALQALNDANGCRRSSDPSDPSGASPVASGSAAPGSREAAEDEIDSFGRRSKKPYHERAYLYYGKGAEMPTLDLTGTKDFLCGLGFDGGELRKARTGKDYAEAVRQAEEKDETGMTCSYCGVPISGVDYYRLPDGRIRCTNCSRTLVKSLSELKEIYKKVLLNLEVFFGASITVPIEIEMLEERKLKKKLKMPLSDVDSKSILVLGVAVEDKKKQYSINLENGAPRLSVIATFAHEMTHIWQFTHWNDPKVFKKLNGPARLLMYEGMAKWAEIQYLYLIGETAAAKREEFFTRQRQDEYGIGFLLYVNKYPLSKDNMPGDDTPFKTSGYPID